MIERRCRFLLLAAWLLGNTCVVAAEHPNTEHPNIVFIAVDDLRPELGCYGHAYVESPNIDRLAEEGIRFDRAYCQQPLCNPSRTSVMTGMRPESVGVLGNHVDFRDRFASIQTLPQYFKDHGYQSVGIGKIFHGPFVDEALCSRWDRYNDALTWSEPAIRFGPRYYFTDEAVATVQQMFKDRYPEYTETNEREWTEALLFGPMTEDPDVDDQQLYDGKVGATALEKLRLLSSEPQPFFLAVGFIKPHTPFIAPLREWEHYDSEQIPLAENPDFPNGSPGLAFHRSGEIRRYSDQPNQGEFSVENQRRLRHGYLACVSHIDTQVGQILDELERLNLRENTIVVLWGDHGYHLGEQSIWGKHTLFENAARVPLIVSAPDRDVVGQSTSAIVELVDLYPTLCELAGLALPEHLEGISFVPILDRPNRDWKQAAFTVQPAQGNWDQGGTVIGRSMRTERFRYTVWIDRATDDVVARQLFDHAEDPLETVNRAELDAYQEQIEELHQDLMMGWRQVAEAVGQ